MSFLDPLFFFFLLVVAAFYWAPLATRRAIDYLPSSWLHFTLILVSLLFYVYYSAVLAVLLVVLAISAYYCANLLRRLGRLNVVVLFIGLFAAFVPLIVFKYSKFFFSVTPWSPIPAGLALVLPLGISFYTFQNVSYIVGVSRGVFPEARNPLQYLLYISFFPQLVAGPIVTAGQFLPQIWRKIGILRLDFKGAAFYLLSGYLKKAIFADHLATVADPAFSNPAAYSGPALIVATLAYTLQIYFDFSGYSDIAIGAGRLFGIRLPENFNFPYSAAGFRDFWRRWHITLSAWLRDHLYIPLGGSRMGSARLVLALLVTMTLGGLWHGAHWNFILWGAAHGLLLVLERPLARLAATWSERSRAILRPAGLLVTFVLAALLWVPFRTGTMENGLERAWWVYTGMFSLKAGIFSETGLRITVLAYGAMLLASFQYERIKSWFERASAPALGASAAAAAIMIIAFAAGGETFIYFVF